MAANRISEYMYILVKTAKLTFILMLIIFASISLFNMNMYQYQALLAYYWSILYAGLFKKGLMMHDDVFACAIYTKSIIQENLFISVIMGMLGLPLFLYLYMPYKKYKYLRGAKFTNRFKLKFKRGKLNCGLCKIPENQECRHFFIVGKPGTGKTVFMLEVLNQLTRHQAKCMIYDFKGDYISRFYDEGTDMIFNPIDERSVYWNFFDDIETELDIETIASILIPQNRKEIWNDAAREVLTGIIYYLWEQNRRTISDLWQCLIAENSAIASILQKTERGKRGYKYIQEVDSKQTIGVIATLTQFTKCFEIIRKPKGQPFTIKHWVNKGTGNLYVSNYSNSQAILKPVLTLFIDMLTKKLLDVQASKQKTYILLDELGTLNRLEGVKRLLTLGRSYKCACFLGIQDIAQIDNVYGSDNRKTMLNSCGNWLIFGVSDYDTARVCSNRIGEIEYYEIEKSYQIGKKGGSASRRKKREFLVLPSELQTMPDLFFIFLIGNQIIKNRLTVKVYGLCAEALKLRQDLQMNYDVDVDDSVRVVETPTIKDHESTLPIDTETPEIAINETQTQLSLFNDNHINRFIAEKIEPDETGRIKKSDLFDIYKSWCGIEKIKPLTKGKFYKSVDSMVKHQTSGQAYYVGIKLK